MPLFVYKAADNSGKIITDKINKNSISDVSEYLRQRGLYPLEIHKFSMLNMEISDLIKRPVNLKSLSLFCRQLSFFLESGMLLPRAFQIMSAQSKDKRIKRMLMDIREHSLEGNSLSDCLKSAPVPPLMPALCRVGEESGQLAGAIGQMADYYEREFKNRQSLTGALIYPAILAAMMFAVMLISVIYVIPNYAAIFESEGITLPLPTRMLMSMSDFVLDYGLFVLIGMILLSCLIVGFLQTKQGKSALGFIQLHMPIWRLGMNLRFCQCLSMLLSAGQPLAESLNIIRDTISNVYMDSTFIYISIGLKQGRRLSALLTEAKYFDLTLINMVEIGEETGSMAKPVSQCAEYYQSEHERVSSLVARLAEPVIMVILGSILGVIMLAVILPTFKLVNSF